MFKAKYIIDNKIYQILDTYKDDILNQTYFLVWLNSWKWINANKFVPPNWEVNKNA